MVQQGSNFCNFLLVFEKMSAQEVEYVKAIFLKVIKLLKTSFDRILVLYLPSIIWLSVIKRFYEVKKDIVAFANFKIDLIIGN